jgi:predicted dehydrogenase
MKVIQVGMGGMGNAWLRAVLDSPEVEYAAFVEVNPVIATEQVQKYGLDGSRVYSSLAAALENVEADGILNVTPPQFHRAVSIMALEAGVPVLSEKPLADTFEAASAIVECANATGVLHMVAQNYRYRSATQTLKRVLSARLAGDAGAASVDFFRGPHFGGFREEMAYPLIIDMSIHHFDLMRFFLEANPESVYGRSWNPAWSWFRGDASAAVNLAFLGSAGASAGQEMVVQYNGSWCSQARETSWNANWRFDCSEGVVTMVDDQVAVQRTGELPDVVEPVVMEREGQAYLLHEFYEAVTQGKAPVTTCQDNLKSLSIVFDVVQSFQSGAVVRSSA